jgi:hypothetical protein
MKMMLFEFYRSAEQCVDNSNNVQASWAIVIQTFNGHNAKGVNIAKGLTSRPKRCTLDRKQKEQAI